MEWDLDFNGQQHMDYQIRADRPRLPLPLQDGTEALFSPIDPEDKVLLEDGLEHLSVQGRFNRFGQGLSHLTKGELDYLTDIDQRSHVAWGAIVDGHAAGVGRYIRLGDEHCAEVAITVIDSLQGLGLGTLLFQALTAVARADGVSRFCFEVMPGNTAVMRMLAGVDVRLDPSGSLLEGILPIEDIPTGPHDAKFVEVINQVRARTAPL